MTEQELIKKYKDAKIEFKNGKPTSINVSVSMKLSTKPYENMNVNSGISYSLNEDADIGEAYEEGWNVCFAETLKKAEEIRSIYNEEVINLD